MLPFFHDGFTGYGFNHIEHFEELRLRGVRMKLLMDGFLLKPPHAMSVYQKEFMRQYVERSNSSMEVLYRRLQTKWSEVYEEIHGVDFCDDGETHLACCVCWSRELSHGLLRIIYPSLISVALYMSSSLSQTSPIPPIEQTHATIGIKTIVTDMHVKES